MKRVSDLLSGLLLVGMLVSLYLVFAYAPLERTMGVVQKIFYFHISAAWIGLVAFCVVFAGSLAYLWSRNELFDELAVASAEIGLVFISIVLITGPLWARPIWNTWWTWDPRLTTTLILWFMYLAYILLQGVGGLEENRARLAAVYGIIAFVNVPLVFFSIRWWRTIHPVVITNTSSGLTPQMVHTLLFTLFTFSLLYICLLRLRYQGIKLAREVEDLRALVHHREGL